MGFANAEQLRELFLSGGMGFLLGAYYDVFRLWRTWRHSSKVSVFVQDCVFFCTAAVVVFLFSLALTKGVVRVYTLCGVAIGFGAYRYTVGLALLRIVTLLYRWARWLVGFAKRWVSAPVRWLGNRLRVPWCFLCEKSKKLAKKSEKILKKGLKPVRNLLYN